jgi:mono/diheme cytochrome c family protein
MLTARGGLALLPLLAAEQALATGDVEEGLEVARTWCARCHVVGTAKPHGGIDSTPLLFLISDKLERYRPHERRAQDSVRRTGQRQERRLPGDHVLQRRWLSDISADGVRQGRAGGSVEGRTQRFGAPHEGAGRQLPTRRREVEVMP